MAFGKINQEMTYQRSPEETLVDLEKALNKLGKVKKIDRSANTITGKVRYGLQSTNIQATVSGSDDKSTISFVAKKGDIGGIAAKNSLERLRETLENVDDLSYEVSRTGLNQMQWIYVVLGVIGVVLLVIMISANPEAVANNQIVIGTLIASYLSWGFMKVFKRE